MGHEVSDLSFLMNSFLVNANPHILKAPVMAGVGSVTGKLIMQTSYQKQT